jgi:hypothetical protein
MSNHSGFSSASMMEIERLNNENKKMAAKNAAEMATQSAQMSAQNAQMQVMQSILAANGIIPKCQFLAEQPSVKALSTSAQAAPGR